MDMPVAGAEDLAATCAELDAINARLFATEHPEAAFHVLAAAIHCATDLGDAPTLRHLEQIAAEQHRLLGQRARQVLPHEATLGATQALRWVSMERIYASAARQASVRASTIELQHTHGRVLGS